MQEWKLVQLKNTPTSSNVERIDTKNVFIEQVHEEKREP